VNDVRDIDDLFAALRGSPFRQRFRLGPRERAYLDEKGLPTVLDHAAELIAQRLAPAEPRNDGRQTPFRGHPVFVAQHATATAAADAWRSGTTSKRAARSPTRSRRMSSR
jgi:hypothetical protein